MYVYVYVCLYVCVCDHINRSFHNFSSQLHGHMPQWMGRFKGVDTTQILSFYSAAVWPPVCERCNWRPRDPQGIICHSCREAAGASHAQTEIGLLPLTRLTQANAPASRTTVAAQDLPRLTFPQSSDATRPRTSGSLTGPERADVMTVARSRSQHETGQEST